MFNYYKDNMKKAKKNLNDKNNNWKYNMLIKWMNYIAKKKNSKINNIIWTRKEPCI